MTLRNLSIVFFAASVFSIDAFLAVHYCNSLGTRTIACVENPLVCNACDFRMRWNEVQAVKQGVNPYDVWSLKTELAPYVPAERYDLRTDSRFEPINAYTPWEYAFFSPLTLLPRNVAWRGYYGMMILSALLIGVYSFCRGAALFGRVSDGLFCAASALFVSMSMWLDFQSGNYPLVLSGALLAMVVALNRGRDCLAGLCWSVVMIKPQVGLLFAIPLLLKGRWKTMLTAGGICLTASLPPAIMTHTSVLELVFQAPAASAYAFDGCGFVPKTVVGLLVGNAKAVRLLMIGGLMVGFAVCLLWTFVLRRKEDWIVLVAPAALCSVFWTYCQDYSFSITWPMLLLFAMEAVKSGSLSRAWPFLLAIALVARVHMVVAKAIEIGGARFCGWTNSPVYSLSGDVMSIVLTVLVSVLCFRMAREKNGRINHLLECSE